MISSINSQLQRIDAVTWKIPRSYKHGMRVDGLIYADASLIETAGQEEALEQVANVACLPGIQKASIAMPDVHWGYGFCIGGVCATDPLEGGVISPGGVGYDINCGVRLVKTNLTIAEVRPRLKDLVSALFRAIPTGAGPEGRFYFNDHELDTIMKHGPSWLIQHGYGGLASDIEYTESHGCLEGAMPQNVSDIAKERGATQCGTLGSGNHFIEVQLVDTIESMDEANAFGLFPGQVCIMIHSGSRGLGHQVCTDYLAQFRDLPERYGIHLPDRQLACAPADSPEGRAYIGAMRAAANFAWANRHLLMMQTRQVFAEIFQKPWEELGISLLYDVAHNIAKLETHRVDEVDKRLWVHRKGATRAFPPGHPEIPVAYRPWGQPVLVPGSMGAASWVMAGQKDSMEKSFGSCCHGAGRTMSRTRAIKDAEERCGGKKQEIGALITQELQARGIVAMSRSRRELAEEQPKAYKDVDAVVNVVQEAGIAKKVARLHGVGVIKG